VSFREEGTNATGVILQNEDTSAPGFMVQLMMIAEPLMHLIIPSKGKKK
jgi:hypothetical protein